MQLRWAGHVARMGTRFWWESLKEGDHSEDQGIDGKMDLKEIGGGVDWIRVAQNRDRWRAGLNVVMNLRLFVTRS
jgi:hypothetical protein